MIIDRNGKAFRFVKYGEYFGEPDSDCPTLANVYENLWRRWLPRFREYAVSKRLASVHCHWVEFPRFERWAVRYGYRPGAILVRRDIERGWHHENVLWVDSFGVELWDGEEAEVFYNGEFVSISDLARAFGLRASRIVVLKRLRSGFTPGEIFDMESKVSRAQSAYVSGKSFMDGKSPGGYSLFQNWKRMIDSATPRGKYHSRGFGVIELGATDDIRKRRRRKKSGERHEIFGKWKRYPGFAKWAASVGYKPGMKFRKRDARKGWNPENCFFASDNGIDGCGQGSAIIVPRHDAVTLTAFGETKTTAAWSRDPRCSVTPDSLRKRLAAWAGVSHEDIITLPATPASERAKARWANVASQKSGGVAANHGEQSPQMQPAEPAPPSPLAENSSSQQPNQ